MFVLIPSCEVMCGGMGRRWRWRRLMARCSDCPGKGSWRSPPNPDTKIKYTESNKTWKIGYQKLERITFSLLWTDSFVKRQIIQTVQEK
jgi:hypothetical protein